VEATLRDPSRPPETRAPGRLVLLPLVDGGSNPLVPPIAATFGELLALDLARFGRYEVVPRARVHAVVDVASPDPARRADPAVAREVGDFLGAEHLVRGSLQLVRGNVLELEVSLVDPDTGEEALLIQDEAPVGDVFALQKRTALTLLQALPTPLRPGDVAELTGSYVRSTRYDGMPITPVQRDRALDGQSRQIQAWLEAGRGFLAADAGDDAGAAARFEEARRIDGGFSVAWRNAELAAAIAGASEAPGELAWMAAAAALQARAVASLLGERRAGGAVTDGRERSAVPAELLGQDRMGSGAILEVEIELMRGVP